MEPFVVKIKVGSCESCRYLECDVYNPAPGPGTITDCGCSIEDTLSEDTDFDPNWGNTEQCPYWEPIDTKWLFCKKHKTFYDANEGCGYCIEEQLKEIQNLG